MIIADKGILPNILIWRGDISAASFDLRLVHTSTQVVTLIKALRDNTPSRLTIKLIPPKDVWATLPSGEYEYYIQDKGRIVATGLLKNIKNSSDYDYDTEHLYTEYRD
jgi:hypothetical protein